MYRTRHPYLLAEHYRRVRGLRLADASRLIGISTSEISHIESGDPVSANVLLKVAALYGCQPAWLQRPLPAMFDPTAVRERLEAEFAGKPDPIGMRNAARRAANARPKPQVPPPPSLAEAIRRGRT